MPHLGSDAKREPPKTGRRCCAGHCPSWARTRTLLIQRGHYNHPNSSNLPPFTRVRVTRCWSLAGFMPDFAVLYSLRCWRLPIPFDLGPGFCSAGRWSVAAMFTRSARESAFIFRISAGTSSSLVAARRVEVPAEGLVGHVGSKAPQVRTAWILWSCASSSARYWWTTAIAMLPSPTAAETRLIEA